MERATSLGERAMVSHPGSKIAQESRSASLITRATLDFPSSRTRCNLHHQDCMPIVPGLVRLALLLLNSVGAHMPESHFAYARYSVGLSAPTYGESMRRHSSRLPLPPPAAPVFQVSGQYIRGLIFYLNTFQVADESTMFS